MARHSVLLIISGSIAAYKSLELIRRLGERDIAVRCILTAGGAQFITPLAVASLSGQPVYGELFSLKDETEMGHIRLTREADLVVAAPASADLIAKMAAGLADDLASATLLASNKPLLVAPAMNTRMWRHKATQRNLQRIVADGATLIEPGAGMLACGETGEGRMAEVEVIVERIGGVMGWWGDGVVGQVGFHHPITSSLHLSALVTSGPTHEAIDPVRYIANRSSGKQGHAIAAALAQAGARVTLISGPTALADPAGVTVARVTTAQEMLAACEQALPVDVAVCAAAVADWRVAEPAAGKLKKRLDATPPTLALVENPDILSLLGASDRRPRLLIGFAAETEGLLAHAAEKRLRKGCDWLLANDVSGGKVFDGDANQVTLISADGQEHWPSMRKEAVAARLVEKIVDYVGKSPVIPALCEDLGQRSKQLEIPAQGGDDGETL